MDESSAPKIEEEKPARKRAESFNMPGADFPPPRRRNEADVPEAPDVLLRRAIGNTLPPHLRWVVRRQIADGIELGQFRTMLKKAGTPNFAVWLLETYWRFIQELPDDDKRREPGKEPA